ncbi:LacI family DNA-binding transcriptional regulator [Hoeflea sp. TYP-13]|uniref:LacI family DNA-binding transcriptional regulator n=1 Tax=Hoeflea sp. TYP-13 TaxID=3230023 RepID=UPI0034C60CA0
MAERVTSSDVARRAGVSQPTVSRVFTPGMRVSPKLEERVKCAADELGYRPNTLARSLITGRSRTIGLIVAYLDNPFYPEALEKLSLALKERGYHILVFLAANQAEEIDPVVEDLLAHQVDGIIIASVGISNKLTERIHREGIPLILFNRGQDDRRLSSVTSANFDGGRRVAEFLVAGGHTRIAHISGWQGSSTGRDRRTGFIAGLKAAGADMIRCIDSRFRREEAMEATRRLFSATEVPDAIFAGNDHMAFAVMDTVRCELLLRIPEDVSIVGYDDVSMAAWPTYGLTTVRQPANQMVEKTVEMLLARIEGDATEPQKLEIDGPLIIRNSARVPEGWT